ncbi:hypothetical protein BC936DRAFT_140276 [Jimgerdemannia flammicorona]|uniref:ERCC4 domain-containing protein n=1 Tax=Jimgerdemannia flammicorona TaxID=994334 RepID=A0A433DH02_9FUNG|nr:hypothetical protein BC936DRAFT_140276 [Jimgerdemannia flammicorona]
MSKQYLDSTTVHIENSLLALPLGALICKGLEQHGATIEGADHSVKCSVTWEPHGDSWVLVVIDKTTDLCKHAEEIQLYFPEQCILYIVQRLGEIDEQWIQLQAISQQCFIMETHAADDSVQWIVQLLGDICTNKKHITAPKVQKGRNAITTWCIMLQQIHGVSEAIAAAIVDHYPSVNSLLEAYEQNPHEAKDLLIGIPVAGKKRNINRTVSMRIHTFLTSNDPKTLINSLL